MPIDEFLKDLPSSNKENFSTNSKQNAKPVLSRFSAHSDDEKRIIFDMKPLLLRYLQSHWGISSSGSASSSRARSERKRTSDANGSPSDEGGGGSTSCPKVRRRNS